MAVQLVQAKEELSNAAIYVDYENIFELLKKYGVNPTDIKFFPVILDKLKNVHKLNIVESIIYCNFEKKSFHGKEQTELQNLGLQTRHSACTGKNCSDLMLTVDTLTTLYKNPNINVFVIISSDRDIIPLLMAIKYENRFTYVLSTKFGFNSAVLRYADHHEYIEDIFNINTDRLIEVAGEELDMVVDNFKKVEVDQAKEISNLLYNSIVWRKYEESGQPVSLKGYIHIVAKKLGREPSQLLRSFQLAHCLKYITIYRDAYKRLCLKKGENYQEVCAKG